MHINKKKFLSRNKEETGEKEKYLNNIGETKRRREFVREVETE